MLSVTNKMFFLYKNKCIYWKLLIDIICDLKFKKRKPENGGVFGKKLQE